MDFGRVLMLITLSGQVGENKSKWGKGWLWNVRQRDILSKLPLSPHLTELRFDREALLWKVSLENLSISAFVLCQVGLKFKMYILHKMKIDIVHLIIFQRYFQYILLTSTLPLLWLLGIVSFPLGVLLEGCASYMIRVSTRGFAATLF